MKILGITFGYHDSGAAIIEDGRILAAVNEERLSRFKKDCRFPFLSINKVLELTKTEPNNIDFIGVAGKSPGMIRKMRYWWATKNNVFELILKTVNRLVPKMNGNADSVEKQISLALGEFNGIIKFVDHHEAHAASTYYTSGFNNATIISCDTEGDYLSSAVYIGNDGHLKKVSSSLACDSLGRIWSRVTTCYGIKGGDEGKFLGLAAHSKNFSTELRIFQNLIQIDGTKFKSNFCRRTINKSYEEECFEYKRIFKDFDPKNVAAALQYHTERLLMQLARNSIKKTGEKKVALSGGVAANVKANQRIYELDEVEEIFVHPNMTDAGLCVGAALKVWADEMISLGQEPIPIKMSNAYLGPEFSDNDIKQAINDFGLIERASKISEVEDYITDKLIEDKVVARFDGRMEYGPRALGNRSILYKPTDPSVMEWLNNRLNRTEFMPFAPVTLQECADSNYLNYSENCHPTEYMAITLDCSEKMKKSQKGVVHIDGTARPQIIKKEVNPSYHKILEKYYEKTGLPSLINTSFNMHGEPIVCSPVDAIKSYLRGGTDVLVLGNWVIE